MKINVSLLIFHIFSTTETNGFLQSKPPFYGDTLFKFSQRYRENLKQYEYMKYFQNLIINLRREVKDENQEILIDKITENAEIFTDDEIYDHVVSFLSTGMSFKVCLVTMQWKIGQLRG